jgi:hypothetical protein
MGSWDCYCAVCGGPFGLRNEAIARKPRSARFRAQHQLDRSVGARDPKLFSTGGTMCRGSVGDHGTPQDEDHEDTGSCDEDHSYDPEVVSQDQIRWSESLLVIGFNPAATGLTK